MRSDLQIGALGDNERNQIDQEHARLERFLSDLRETCSEFSTHHDCSACDRSKQACCQGRLASFFYDFMDLVAQHIENEEAILLTYLANPADSTYFREHQQSHVEIMRGLRGLMAESVAMSKGGATAQAIRQLDASVSTLFGGHARDFDDRFLHPG